MDAMLEMGRVLKARRRGDGRGDGIGCAKLVIFANVPDDNPFMAGALHGVGEPDCVINVGAQGPGVVLLGARSGCARRASRSTLDHRRDDQAHGVQGHARRRADRPRGGAPPRSARALRHRRPLARADAGGRRLRRGDPRGDGARERGRARLDRGAGDAHRRRQEGRRDGVVVGRRPLGRLHPRQRGRRHGRRGARRGAVAREARGDDRRLLGRPRHDRRARRHDAETLAAIIADEIAIGVINHKTTAVRIIPVPGKQAGESVPSAACSAKRSCCRSAASAPTASSGRAAASPRRCRRCAIERAIAYAAE